jgi:3-oxoacyl-[acyl-carrier-protein] synthase I
LEVFTSYHHILSPLGSGSGENLSAVLNNRTGFKQLTYGKTGELFCLSVIPNDLIEKVNSTISNESEFTRLEKFSIHSIQNVLDVSGVSLEDAGTLLIYSTTKGNIDLLEPSLKTSIPKERAHLSAMANAIGRYFNAKNTPMVLSNACISGLLAILVAKRLIVSGQYHTIVVCGGDLVTEFTVSGFKSFNALSPNPCKPFDARREGINLGEAAATIVITNKKELKTNSSMLIVNGASANDANHISGPSRTGDGLFQALQQTVAGMATNIDAINAHGTATPYNDEMESVAFERAGLTNIPVNSLKGYYGHTLGAAGVLETIIAIESASQDQLIRSAGFEEPGVSGKIEVIKEHSKKTIKNILKTASGFGGCNAAVLFSKWN